MDSMPSNAGALDMARHAYALDVSGYTILPAQVTASELEALRTSADRALAAARSALRAGI